MNLPRCFEPEIVRKSKDERPARWNDVVPYDENGNLLTVTDAASQTTAIQYDLHDRVVQRTDPLGRIDTYAYDAAGNLTTATDRRGAVTTVTYDGLNRPVILTVVQIERVDDSKGRLARVCRSER